MNQQQSRPKYVLFLIVISFFMVTSLWFVTNIIITNLSLAFKSSSEDIASNLVSIVQFGFMLGTFVFALTNITDKLSPKSFFFINACIGAISNLLILYVDNFPQLMILRFITGICMGGVYPAAIKMTATWFSGAVLGKAMGFTIGALALGTAFPHILSHLGTQLVPSQVIYIVVTLAFTGGCIIYFFVPNGPFLKNTSHFSFNNIIIVFKINNYRRALFGFLGHMWELFAFWQFLPVFISYYNKMNHVALPVSLISYFTIAFGFLGCILGGYFSVKFGSLRVAKLNLILSGLCCLFSPFLIKFPPLLFLAVLLVWGVSVLGDSPQFSTLVSQVVPLHLVGTAITIMTCIGYTCSILSLQLLSYVSNHISSDYLFSLLLLGPLFGYWVLPKKIN